MGKKTPLHVMTGEAVHEKCKSKTLITSFNHLGISESYSEVIRRHHNLAQYVINQTSEKVPLPSHFSSNLYTTVAFDNFDHNESTLSGINSSHDTVCVVFQEKSLNVPVKPNVSETNIVRGEKAIHELLSCQKLQPYVRPARRPDLPADYKVDSKLFEMDEDKKKSYEKIDKMWHFCRVTNTQLLQHDSSNVQNIPSWSAFNALCTKDNQKEKKVGFLPVIPHPVTQHATVFTALVNFTNLLNQLDQNYLPVFCDEGVYAIAREITLGNPSKFSNIILVLGSFHMTKIVLGCLGKYLRGSGISSVFVECSVFGVNVIESVLQGKNYVRGVKGMTMLGECLFRLQLYSFLKENSVDKYKIEITDIHRAKKNLYEVIQRKGIQAETDCNIEKLLSDFAEFTDIRRKTSEQFLYWDNFLRMLQLLKNLIRADRQGLWDLHLDTVQMLQPLFAVFDCVNYQRWSSLYLEDMRRLPHTAPEVHDAFMAGHHVIKRHGSSFTSVAADMALEQTINRSQKSPSGIIGRTKQKEFVAEWEITHHERLMISSLFREITASVTSSDNLNIHHEMASKKTLNIEEKVSSMYDYILDKGNPFEIRENSLHNIVTKAVVPQESKEIILKLFDIGIDTYTEFRKTRYEEKTTRISGTIRKVSLPACDSVKAKLSDSNLKMKKKDGMAYRMIQISQARGYGIQDLFSYDLSDKSMLFDQKEFLTTPQKSNLIKEKENSYYQDTSSYRLHSDDKTCYVFDVMNSLRKIMTVDQKTFRGTLLAFIAYSQNISKNCSRIDYVFDSYHKMSPKSSQRLHRKESKTTIEIAKISEEVPLPIQLDTFWGSSNNKLMLQRFIAESTIASLCQSPSPVTHTFSAFSGDEQDFEVFKCTSVLNGVKRERPKMNVFDLEEGNFRKMVHCKHAAHAGLSKLVLVSADTDIIVEALYHWTAFQRLGMKELWVKTGVGDSTRVLPVHVIHAAMGSELCELLPAVHAISGADYTSKFGTKKAALTLPPKIC